MAGFDKEEPAAATNRINPKCPDDIGRLARDLGVSPYHLSKIVNRVGPMLSDIYYALGLREWEIPKRGAPQEDPPAP